MASPLIPVPRTVLVRLAIPEDLLKSYEVDAEANHKSLDQILVERLNRCKLHSAISPLYFDDEERHSLESVLGTGLKSPGAAVAAVKAAQTIKVQNVNVTLPAPLLKRMLTRTFGRSMAETIKLEVVKGLETFVGLRG